MTPGKPRQTFHPQLSPDAQKQLELMLIGGENEGRAQLEFARLADINRVWALKTIREQDIRQEDAIEIFQDALLKMWSERKKAKSNYDCFKDWLLRAVMFTILGRRRASHDGISLDGDAINQTPIDAPATLAMDDDADYPGDNELTEDAVQIDRYLAIMPSQEGILAAYTNPYAQALHEILNG